MENSESLRSLKIKVRKNINGAYCHGLLTTSEWERESKELKSIKTIEELQKFIKSKGISFDFLKNNP